MAGFLPKVDEPLVDQRQRITRAWHAYFSSLGESAPTDDLRRLYERLAERVAEVEREQRFSIIGQSPIDVAGTPSTGAVVFSLSKLPDTGGGALRKIDRDEFGRVAGTSAATTDNLTEGVTNLYYSDARVDARIVANGGIQVGEVLVADGISPPVMLTDDAETDFLYQG